MQSVAQRSARRHNGQSGHDSKAISSSAATAGVAGGASDGPQVRVRRKVNPASPPTSVELCGVTVHFPFRPYKCQESYMTKVLQALSRSENALLESPTGTGKTLCLLCSTLAWQRSQAQLLLNHKSESTSAIGSSSSITKLAGSQNRVPTIIYASRTHSQLSQVVRELRNTRYRPAHAVLGSREHMCVHPKVNKLHSSSSNINHECSKLGKERKCRYRNALDGFVPPSNEHLDHPTDGGGGGCASMSLNPQHQPIMDMEEMIQMGKTMNVCPFYYTRGLVEHAELILVPYNYLFDKDARETTLQDVPWENAVVIFDEAHNLESFASDSASFDLSNTDLAGCVNEVERALNYLHVMPPDSDAAHNLKQDNLLRLKALFLKLEDYIVNQIPNHKTAFGGEYMMHLLQQAAGITHGNHEILMDEIRKVNDLILDLKGTGAMRGSPRLEHFCQCLKRVFGHKMEAKCLAKANFYRVHVSPKQTTPFTGTRGATHSTSKAANNCSRTISYWCFAPSLAMEELANLNVRSILVTSGTLSPLPSYSMELGLPFPHMLENPHIIDAQHQLHVRVIGKGITGKLLTSSYDRRKDDDYYIELGQTLVRLAQIIPAGVLVFFPSYGVMDVCLEKWDGPSSGGGGFSSNTTKKGDFFAPQRKKKNGGPTTANQFVFPQIPSSFNSTTSRASMSSCWRQLLAVKSVVLEPRSSSDLNEAIGEFQRLLALPKSPGCILMGVCRGKISEGIDFAGDMSRAVIITGIPFAPAMDAKVKLKREYLDGAVRAAALAKQQRANDRGGENGGGFGQPQEQDLRSRPSLLSSKIVKLSGNEWYQQQAHRAVNQAVGRVIRSRTDYGAVLLLDSRFDQERNQSGLSKWIRPHVRKDEGFVAASKELDQFYKAIQKKSFEVVVAETVPPPPCPPLFDKEDGNDENTENSSRIALIRKQDSKPAATSQQQEEHRDEEVHGSGSYIPPNQVIATLNVNAFGQKKEHHPLQQVASSSSGSQGSEESKKGKSAYDIVFQKPRAPKPPTKAKPASERDAAAVRFMQGTKSLPVTDQAKVRKAIIVMKKASDDRDVRAYRQSAQEVLRLLIRQDVDGTIMQQPQDSLLFIFFQLLPQAYKLDTETIARKIVFDSSPLNDLAKRSIGPADYNRLKSSVLGLIQNIWLGDSASASLGSRPISQRINEVLHEVVSIVCRKCADKNHSRPMCAALIRMLPSLYKENALKLIDETMARRNVDDLKERDRAGVGAAGMDMRRFALPKRRSSLPPPGAMQEQGAAVKSCSSLTVPPAGGSSTLVAKHQSQPQKNNPYSRRSLPASNQSTSTFPNKNPYARRSSSSLDPLTRATTNNESESRKRPRLDTPPQQEQQQKQSGTIQNAPKSPKTPVTAPVAHRVNPYRKTGSAISSKQPPHSSSSINTLLNTVGSDVFVRSVKKSQGVVQRPDSNAPKNLACVICEKSLPQPFLAPCGHLACLACWRQWLEKSRTCPVCRASCTLSKLAQAVFDSSAKSHSNGGNVQNTNPITGNRPTQKDG